MRRRGRFKGWTTPTFSNQPAKLGAVVDQGRPLRLPHFGSAAKLSTGSLG